MRLFNFQNCNNITVTNPSSVALWVASLPEFNVFFCPPIMLDCDYELSSIDDVIDLCTRTSQCRTIHCIMTINYLYQLPPMVCSFWKLVFQSFSCSSTRTARGGRRTENFYSTTSTATLLIHYSITSKSKSTNYCFKKLLTVLVSSYFLAVHVWWIFSSFSDKR